MKLEISIEGEEPQVYPLRQEKIVIGSGDDCDIVIKAEGISRKHLTVVVSPDEFFVIDQGSTNGSYINDERLIPGKRIEFTSFFPVKLGHMVFASLLSDEDVTESFDFSKELNTIKSTKPAEEAAEDVKKESTRVISREMLKQSQARPTASLSSSGGAKARTAAKQRASEKRKGPTKGKSTKKKTESSSLIVRFLAAALVCGSGYMIYRQQQSDVDTSPAAQAEARLDDVAARMVEADKKKLLGLRFKPAKPLLRQTYLDLSSTTKCASEKEIQLCTHFGLTPENGTEGITEANGEIVVFLRRKPMIDVAREWESVGRIFRSNVVNEAKSDDIVAYQVARGLMLLGMGRSADDFRPIVFVLFSMESDAGTKILYMNGEQVKQLYSSNSLAESMSGIEINGSLSLLPIMGYFTYL